MIGILALAVLGVILFINRKYIQCSLAGHAFVQRTRYVKRCSTCHVTAYHFDETFQIMLPPDDDRHSRR